MWPRFVWGVAACAAAAASFGCDQLPQATGNNSPSVSAAKPLRGLSMRTPEKLMFGTAQAQLSAGAEPFLDHVAARLREHPAANAVIEGHTDAVGGEILNRELSEVRALLVLKALVDRGIDRGRLRAVGYGASRPIASNDTEAGRRLNRRTDILIEPAPVNPGQQAADGGGVPPNQQ